MAHKSQLWLTEYNALSVDRILDSTGVFTDAPATFKSNTSAIVVSPPSASGRKRFFSTKTRGIYAGDDAAYPLLETLPVLPWGTGLVQSAAWDSDGKIIWSTTNGLGEWRFYEWDVAGGGPWTQIGGGFSTAFPGVAYAASFSQMDASRSGYLLFCFGTGTSVSSPATWVNRATGAKTVAWRPLTSAGGPLTTGTITGAEWDNAQGLGIAAYNANVGGLDVKSGLWKFRSDGTTHSGPYRLGLSANSWYGLSVDQTGQWWLRHADGSGGDKVAQFDPVSMAITAGPFLSPSPGVWSWQAHFGGPVGGPLGGCEEFTGTITGTGGIAEVTLSVEFDNFAGGAGSHRIAFVTNTTGHALPSGVGAFSLNEGPWSLGEIDVGEIVQYRIWRADLGPISGYATMRARDADWDINRDVIAQCAPLSGGRWVIGRVVV